MYPAYAVGDADNNIETTRVATVTGQRSSPNRACGEEIPATGEGDTESSTCGCEPSSADGFGTDVTLLPRWTAPTTAAASATATRPKRLDRRGVFLLREVRWSKGDYIHDTPIVCRVGGILCCVCR